MSERVDMHGETKGDWIGVDLDGTLATYNGWVGPQSIGAPIPKMVDRVARWLREGKDVRILTARVAPGKPDENECRHAIMAWCVTHLGRELPITHAKDHKMIVLWDDRVVQVIPNTGERADEESARLAVDTRTRDLRESVDGWRRLADEQEKTLNLSRGEISRLEREVARLEEVLALATSLVPHRVQARRAPPTPPAPYGYCPACLAPGVFRERRMNGDDTCANGHTYPSRDAWATVDGPSEKGGGR